MESSPFDEEYLKNEKKDKNGGCGITDFVMGIFVRGISSEDIVNLPSAYVFFSGAIFYICAGGVFACFLYLNLQNILSTKYLSYGSKETSFCEVVLQSNTQTILADINGNWEGSQGFSYALALYRFEFKGYSASTKQFSMLMNAVHDDLRSTGAILSSSNLGESLLYMSSYSYYNGDTISSSTMALTLTVDPVSILDKSYHLFSLYKAHTVCDIFSTTVFDHAQGLVSSFYPFEQYSNSNTCISSLATSNYGYSTWLNGGLIKFSIDVRALFTAIAINTGRIKINSLVEIPSLSKLIAYDNVMLSLKVYQNPRYPQSSSIQCLTYDESGSQTQTQTQIMCVLKISGGLVGIPFFNHRGLSWMNGTMCECSGNIPSASEEAECNLFKLFYGLIFWDTVDPSPIARFFLASKSSTLNADTFPSYPLFSNFLFMSNTTCNDMEYGQCSTLVFSTSCDDNSPSTVIDYSVSPHKYQVMNAYCNTSLSIPTHTWQKLIKTPFSNLTQEYTACKYGFYDSFMQAVGIAAGTVGTLMPVIICIALGAAYLLSYLIKTKPLNFKYSREELTDVLDVLAFNLLLTRDTVGKCIGTVGTCTGDVSLRDDDSYVLLSGLVEELRARAKVSPFVEHGMKNGDMKNGMKSGGMKGDIEDIDFGYQVPMETPSITHVTRAYAQLPSSIGTELADLSCVHTSQGSQLSSAISRWNVASVKIIITKSPELINSTVHGTTGCTPLQYAVLESCTEIVQWLLENGANVDMKDEKNGNTALHMCTEVGMVKLLCKYGSNVNAVNTAGENPVLVHVRTGNLDCVHALLQRGGNPTVTTLTDRRNSIHQAAYGGDFRILSILFNKTFMHENGKNNFMDENRKINFMHENGKNIENDKNIFMYENEKNTFMHEKNIFMHENQGSTIDMDAVDIHGCTYLHHVMMSESPRKEHVRCLELLINKGTRVEAIDNKGSSCLHYACKSRYLLENSISVPIVQYLLHEGLKPNSADLNKCTPLLLACKLTDWEVVKLLLLVGGDLNVVGNISGVDISGNDLIPENMRCVLYRYIHVPQQSSTVQYASTCSTCNVILGSRPLDGKTCGHCGRVICRQCGMKNVSRAVLMKQLSFVAQSKASAKTYFCTCCIQVLAPNGNT